MFQAAAGKVLSKAIPHANMPSKVPELFDAKARKGLTFDQIGQAIGKDETWVASAFHGQVKFSPEDLKKVAETLDIPSGVCAAANLASTATGSLTGGLVLFPPIGIWSFVAFVKAFLFAVILSWLSFMKNSVMALRR